MWRGHKDASSNRHRLRQRELCIRGSRRQVNDEIVKVAPLHVAKELLNRATDEGPAPDDRLPLRDEELNGDDLDAVALDRLDLAASARLPLPSSNTSAAKPGTIAPAVACGTRTKTRSVSTCAIR